MRAFYWAGLHGGRMDVIKEVSPVRGFTGGSLAEVLLLDTPDPPPHIQGISTIDTGLPLA